MPVYPRTRKSFPGPHVCKPPRCWFFTPWRWRWIEGSNYYCDKCQRNWYLREMDSDDGRFLAWFISRSSTYLGTEDPLPFHPIPLGDE